MATTYFLVTVAVFFWAANFVLAGPVLADQPPLWAASLRFLLGAALMIAIAGFRREDLKGLLSRYAGTYLLLGTVGIAAFNLFFFYALRITSAANAALIMATNPLLTTLLASALLGEKPTMRHLVALPVALAGVAVVISSGNLASFSVSRGDLLMLAANASWALYNVLGKKYMPRGSALGNTSLVMAAGAAVLFGAAMASGTHMGELGARAAMALAVMAVGGTVLAYLFWSMGIMRLGAARTAIFLNLVPVFAMLIEGALGTSPTAAQLAGGFLVLCGVSIAMFPSLRTV